VDARAIIAKLRDRTLVSSEEMSWFANGLASGEVSDAQAGAFAMAVCLNGLAEPARVALTGAMRDTGDVLAWDLPGPVIDKHSTGGVGDCVSLLLAPALAACGAYVPMISGRGLGHTGGTLDKLEAIPGYRVEVSAARLAAVVREVGCAIVGASGRIAPADKRLYAIRDVTATVQSLDLITASILSKKLAAGLEGVLLDVKCGSGAFMKTRQQALALADSLVRVARGAGCAARALVSDMNQPLARNVGNALELAEVMAVLTGDGESPRLRALTVALGGALLHLGGLASVRAEGEAAVAAALADGRAAERFGRMVAALGGPRDFVRNWRAQLPEAPVVCAVAAGERGSIVAIDAEALGYVVVALGGGRQRDKASIDPAVGLAGTLGLGAEVTPDTVLALVHARDEAAAARAAQDVRAAYVIGEAGAAGELIMERVE